MRPSVSHDPPGAGGCSVEHRDRWLVVRLDREHDILSSAIVRGGRVRARSVAWLEVGLDELRPPVDARRHLRKRLAENGLDGSVGLLTSRDLGAYVDATRSDGARSARTIATVGLSNALRVGDPTTASETGTINLLCLISVRLRPEALVEALSIAAEARTAAILETGVPSRVSGRPATGTGTDCIVVASPCGGTPEPYAGKHTLVGSLIGASVFDAIRRGAEGWKAEQRRALPGSDRVR